MTRTWLRCRWLQQRLSKNPHGKSQPGSGCATSSTDPCSTDRPVQCAMHNPWQARAQHFDGPKDNQLQLVSVAHAVTPGDPQRLALCPTFVAKSTFQTTRCGKIECKVRERWQGLSIP